MMLTSGIKKLTCQISFQRNFKINFLNDIRIMIFMLTFIFILSINVFLTSNTLDKRFHRAIRNEEIDGSIDSTKRNLNRTSTFKMDVTISLQESTKSMISEQQDSQMLNNECFLMRNLMNKRSKNKNIDKLCDLLITIKTTKTNHRSRIKLIIDTWFKLISSKVK